jgi:hypothetical protein
MIHHMLPYPKGGHRPDSHRTARTNTADFLFFLVLPTILKWNASAVRERQVAAKAIEPQMKRSPLGCSGNLRITQRITISATRSLPAYYCNNYASSEPTLPVPRQRVCAGTFDS